MQRDPADGIDALVESLHSRLTEEHAGEGHARDDIARLARREHPLARAAVLDDVVDRVLARTDGLDALEPLLRDPVITEVMVNGRGPVWIERHGTLEETEVRLTPRTVFQFIERVIAPLGLRVDRTSPLIDARLSDGSRVNVVIPPFAIDGPCITIRRFGARVIALDELASAGVAELLAWAVQ